MKRRLMGRLTITGLISIGFFSLSGHAPVFAAEPDVTGLWRGQTVCPLGAVTLELDIEGNRGEFRHHGYGPSKQHPTSHPVKLRFMTGWEGEWVYFTDEAEPSKSWGSFNGLLSANGDSILIRDETSRGACDLFAFKRVDNTPPPAAASVAEHRECPSDAREPTADEMRVAVEALGNIDINLGLVASSTRFTDFEKVACEKAVGLAGYNCDYKAYIDYQLNDPGYQQFVEWMRGAYGATGPDYLVGRFVCSNGRWNLLPVRDR